MATTLRFPLKNVTFSRDNTLSKSMYASPKYLGSYSCFRAEHQVRVSLENFEFRMFDDQSASGKSRINIQCMPDAKTVSRMYR